MVVVVVVEDDEDEEEGGGDVGIEPEVVEVLEAADGSAGESERAEIEDGWASMA